MKKVKYKNERNSNRIQILTIFVILFIVLFILLFILLIINNNINNKNVSYSNLRTVKDVLNYYECTYISEKESLISGYAVDIKLKFRYNLYNEDDTSNESFFNNVINDIAKVLYYKNFRMIDEENKIEIKVECIDTSIDKIIINDREDYFIYMDSQISLKKYVEINPIELSIDSTVLNELIQNNWNKINFGTRESIFNSYYIFFDEGINVRYIDSKVYNIIFTPNYNDNVVNGIRPGADLKAVKSKLGEPHFKDDELNVIGYKGNNMYAFFSENEISVYRFSEDRADSFFYLVDKFLNKEEDFLEFMNELTYMWPDYSDYNYSAEQVFLSYPLRGIDIKINYDGTDGFVLYNNLNYDIYKVKDYLENTEFVAHLKLDNVYEAEKRRFKNNSSLLERCNEYMENLEEQEQEKIGKSNLFSIYLDLEDEEDLSSIVGIKFVSKDNKNANREISDNINSFLWINDEIFLYGKSYKGIYYYNVITGQIGCLITGTDEFKLYGFKDGVLEYDDSELMIQY